MLQPTDGPGNRRARAHVGGLHMEREVTSEGLGASSRAQPQDPAGPQPFLQEPTTHRGPDAIGNR